MGKGKEGGYGIALEFMGYMYELALQLAWVKRQAMDVSCQLAGTVSRDLI